MSLRNLLLYHRALTKSLVLSLFLYSITTISSAPDIEYMVLTADGKPAGKIILRMGDITQQKVDAIVNAANESLLGGDGIDRIIHTAAEMNDKRQIMQPGASLYDFNKQITPVSPGVHCPIGKARISPSFNLQKKGINYIISTVGPRGENEDKEKLIQNAYASVINLAAYINERITPQPIKHAGAIKITTVNLLDKNLIDANWQQNANLVEQYDRLNSVITSIAFPLISAGIYGYDVKESAPRVVPSVIATMQAYATKLQSVGSTQSKIEPFTIIFNFAGNNPDPNTAREIYVEQLKKNPYVKLVTTKKYVAEEQDLTANLLTLSQQLSTLHSTIQ